MYAAQAEGSAAYYDFYCRNRQTIRHARIVKEDNLTYTVRVDLIGQSLTIAKKDLTRPPVLVSSPTIPEKKASPDLAKPGPAAVDPGIVQPPVAPMLWGNLSVTAAGFAALRDIRLFRTYGFGASVQYMLPNLFSERHRLFARLQATRFSTDNFAYFFAPAYAGLHTTVYQFTPQLALYGELALGFGFLEITRGDIDKTAWRGSFYAAMGGGYFILNRLSLNLEFAGTFITRDESAGNILRLQLALVWHI